jgi:hypothetical protein
MLVTKTKDKSQKTRECRSYASTSSLPFVDLLDVFPKAEAKEFSVAN